MVMAAVSTQIDGFVAAATSACPPPSYSSMTSTPDPSSLLPQTPRPPHLQRAAPSSSPIVASTCSRRTMRLIIPCDFHAVYLD
jgi:hypothetical protein